MPRASQTQTEPTMTESSLAAINGEHDSDETPSTAGLSDASISQLATAIVGAVTAAQGPRKITAAEHQRERSVHRDKPLLTRKVFQNGFMLTRKQLSADAIHFANEIQPGVYADGMLQVVLLRDGTTGTALDIRYPNKSVDERMALASRFPSIEHMLATIVREQKQTATV